MDPRTEHNAYVKRAKRVGNAAGATVAADVDAAYSSERKAPRGRTVEIHPDLYATIAELAHGREQTINGYVERVLMERLAPFYPEWAAVLKHSRPRRRHERREGE